MISRSNPFEKFFTNAGPLLLILLFAIPFFIGLQSGTNPVGQFVKGTAVYHSNTLTDDVSIDLSNNSHVKTITDGVNTKISY